MTHRPEDAATGGGTQATRLLVIALVVQLAVSVWVMPFVPDDAYISFRYAEHLAGGDGLTFNAGDAPVEGYSNFLWILVLALLRSVGLTLPVAAPVVGLALGLLCTIVVWRILASHYLPKPITLLALLVMATAGPFVIYSVSGLETPLFALLLLILVVLVEAPERSPGRLALLTVAGVGVGLCRPEGVLAFPVVLVILAARGGLRAKQVVTAAALFVVLYGSYMLWRINYFDAFWPTPFLSKSSGGLGGLVGVWVKNLRNYFVVQGPGFPPVGFYFLALGLISWTGWRRFSNRCDAPAIAFGVALVYAAVYINFSDWMPGMRYHAALLPLLVLPAAHAISGISTAEKWIATTVAAVLLLNLAVFAALRLSAKRLERGTQECLIPLASWLVEHGPQNPTLAVSDVGAIPYYTGFRTIDINPQSLTDRHIAQSGFSPAYLYEKKAEVLVMVSQGVHLPRFYPEHYAMTQSKQFDDTYRLIGVARYDWYQDRSYWVYFPRDWPRLDDAAYDAFPAGVGRLRRVNR